MAIAENRQTDPSPTLYARPYAAALCGFAYETMVLTALRVHVFVRGLYTYFGQSASQVSELCRISRTTRVPWLAYF